MTAAACGGHTDVVKYLLEHGGCSLREVKLRTPTHTHMHLQHTHTCTLHAADTQICKVSA